MGVLGDATCKRVPQNGKRGRFDPREKKAACQAPPKTCCTPTEILRCVGLCGSGSCCMVTWHAERVEALRDLWMPASWQNTKPDWGRLQPGRGDGSGHACRMDVVVWVRGYPRLLCRVRVGSLSLPYAYELEERWNTWFRSDLSPSLIDMGGNGYDK